MKAVSEKQHTISKWENYVTSFVVSPKGNTKVYENFLPLKHLDSCLKIRQNNFNNNSNKIIVTIVKTK